MKKINLRDFYPEIYNDDHFATVPDGVLLALSEAERGQEAYRIRAYRHKAYFSLDYGDDIERESLFTAPSPHDLYMRKIVAGLLSDALAILPDKQRRRVCAHYFLGMSKADIARSEGVGERAVRYGIERGLRNMGRFLKKLL